MSEPVVNHIEVHQYMAVYNMYELHLHACNINNIYHICHPAVISWAHWNGCTMFRIQSHAWVLHTDFMQKHVWGYVFSSGPRHEPATGLSASWDFAIGSTSRTGLDRRGVIKMDDGRYDEVDTGPDRLNILLYRFQGWCDDWIIWPTPPHSLYFSRVMSRPLHSGHRKC